jgi:hypothetical protein
MLPMTMTPPVSTQLQLARFGLQATAEAESIDTPSGVQEAGPREHPIAKTSAIKSAPL